MVMDADEAARIVARNQNKERQKKARNDLRKSKMKVRACQHELGKLGFSKDDLAKLGFKNV